MDGRPHENLTVWKEAMTLVTEIYGVTRTFPREELYGLTSQMRRAAVSVPSNIAEGAARDGEKEFVRFLMVARGSLAELETQLRIAEQLNYFDSSEGLLSKTNNIGRKLNGLIRQLRNRNSYERTANR